SLFPSHRPCSCRGALSAARLWPPWVIPPRWCRGGCRISDELIPGGTERTQSPGSHRACKGPGVMPFINVPVRNCHGQLVRFGAHDCQTVGQPTNFGRSEGPLQALQGAWTSSRIPLIRLVLRSFAYVF